jgi:hypothetical protein
MEELVAESVLELSQHSSTELSSIEYDGSVMKAMSSRTRRPVTANAWKYGAPSRTVVKPSQNVL